MEKGKIVQMEEKLEKWASFFKVLGHPIRLATIFILYGSDVLRGRGSLRFNEIEFILGLPPRTNLTHHLNRLLNAGLIEKSAHKDEAGQIYPLYHISSKGKEFLRDFNIMEPLRDEILEHLKT